jgi:hypothetical protein
MHHSGVLKILARHFCIVYLVVFTSSFLLSDDSVQEISAQRVRLLPLLPQPLRMPVSCVVSGNRAWGSATCTVLAARRARAELSGGLLA